MSNEQLKFSEERKDISTNNNAIEASNTMQANDLMSFSPSQLLILAVQQGFDIQRLEKLIELQEHWEAKEARRAYHEAMARFKKNPPQIYKDMMARIQTQKGVHIYNYASLGNIVEKLSTALADYSFSSRWDVKQKDGKVVVTNIITHELGHSESVTLELPYDTTGFKNPIQSIGSALSYGERYTFLANVGLATNEFDTDANVSEKEKDRKIFKKLEEKVDQLPHDNSDGFESARQRKFFLDWQAADQDVRTRQFQALLKNRPDFRISHVFPNLNTENVNFADLPIQAQVSVLWYLMNLQKTEQKS